MNKIPLVYIGGAGYCGSTLLNLILDSHPKVVGAGELQFYSPDTIRGRKCTCGKRGTECVFWSKVTDRLRDKLLQEGRDLEELHLQKTTFLSLRQLWRIGNLSFYSDKKPLSKSALDKLNQDSALLMKTILEVADKEIILDASKSAARLFYLSQSNLFDIKLIHLVRDGRAFINSSLDRDDHPDVPPYRATLHWDVRNYRILKMAKNFDDERALRVQYEKLVSKPESELRRICKFIGVEFKKNILNYTQATHHVFAGNPMRKNPKPEIKLIESWKENNSFKDNATFNLLGGTMNKRLGY